MSFPLFLDDFERPSVQLSRTLTTTPDRLWAAIADPELLPQWFPAEMSFDPSAGSPIRFAQDATEADGQVTAYEPLRRFAFTWSGDELDLAIGPDTTLTLTHTFDDRAGAASFATGWESCFDLLEAHLAGSTPPKPGRRVNRHEELVAHFGLDQPVITRNSDTWSVLSERQMTAPAMAVWNSFFGVNAQSRTQRTAPSVGETLHPAGAPDVVLGTVTECDEPVRFSFDTSPEEPGNRVRLHLGAGTGHGARLFLEVSGTNPDEIEAAIDQWGAGALAHLAKAAAR
jgi:uncharacterized protein YndB with AHSA1/START domain